MDDWNPERDKVGAPRRITGPRTLLAKERGEMAAYLRDQDIPEEVVTELLDYAELNGDLISYRWGVGLFLTPTSWGADIFSAIRPEESADGDVATETAALCLRTAPKPPGSTPGGFVMRGEGQNSASLPSNSRGSDPSPFRIAA